MEVVGGKQGGTSLQGAHHNLTLTVVLSKQNWRHVGGLEVVVRLMLVQLGMLMGYNHIVQYVYHCTLLQLLVNLLPRFLRNFNPSDIEITWFRKWNSWSTKTRDANSQTCFAPLCRYLITTWFLFLHSKSMTFSCGLMEPIYTNRLI